MRHLFLAGISAAAIVCSAAPAFAQDTTSSIRGVVTAGDAPVANAQVSILHVPSGTSATTSTGADGAFNASGLRIGGPFTVTVKASGFADATITDVQLTAGQPLRLPVALESIGNDIVVSASSIVTTELSSGPITALTREDIEGVASVSRDIRDVVRRDPFATIDPANSRGVVIAGQNSRLNKFSVDGLRFSDNFGLNNGGLPTARGPVPLAAIEQLSVKIAPYDISEGDFQGGAINLVLRSGGNSFTGSGFYSYTSDKLTGDRTRDRAVALDFKSKNYGGFLSGPILKDKLFFALSYERLDETQPQAIGIAGFANPVPNLTAAQITQIDGIASSVYNYATGGVFSSVKEKDEKYTAKIDWNVTDGHRLSATYIHNFGSVGQNPGFSSTVPASPALTLTSNNYLRPETVDSGVVQLNSDWSDNFHTEIRGNYREYDLLPTPFGAAPFGQFQVCLDPTAALQQNGAANTNPFTCSQGTTAAPGAARLYFGPDRFRHANLVQTKQYGAEVTARWEWQNHSVKVNAAWSHVDVTNVFVSDFYGTYYFDSVADLQARRAGSVTLAGSTTGNLADVVAGFSYDQYTFGFQDSWDVTDRLNVILGTRVDLYGMNDRPPANVFYQARYPDTNRYTFSGKVVPQPRIGATWKATDRLTIRAGAGLFAGGTPDVFLGNSFSVAGVFNNSITIQRLAGGGCNVDAALCSAALDNVNGRTINPLVTQFLQTNTGALSLANTNSMSGDYQPASTWKTSLSVDYEADLGAFGDGWKLGGDVYYGIINDAPAYRDLRLQQVGTLPDGRPRYASTTAGANTDLFLYNTSKGHSLVAVARFDKQFDFGLGIGASYTYQDITDRSPMNGTTASGGYGQVAMVDPNRPAYGTSIYQIRDSVKFNLDYDHAFFGDNKTRFALFGEWRSGLPYSLTMNDPVLVNSHSSVFGTAGNSNRYLLYVPTVGDTRVVFDSAATQASFDAFVAANKLGKYRGRVIDKNTQTSPHWFKVDLHVDQDIPLPLGAKVNLFADMENVLNFIDKDWGSLRQVAFPYLAQVVNVACVAAPGNACAQYRYSSFQNPAIDNQARFSLWSLRIGARVTF